MMAKAKEQALATEAEKESENIEEFDEEFIDTGGDLTLEDLLEQQDVLEAKLDTQTGLLDMILEKIDELQERLEEEVYRRDWGSDGG